MWRVGEVKDKGKWAFKKNYWRAVIVALLFSFFVGGGGTVSSFTDGFKDGLRDGYNESLQEDDEEDEDYEESLVDDEEDDSLGALVIIYIVVAVIVLFAIAIALVFFGIIDAFIVNPIEVGIKNFYLKNLYYNASPKEMLSAFDTPFYKNIVKVMIIKDLKTILWGLLFIVPGVIKSYEYKMIPYILGEHPEMTKEQAFMESKLMMNGQKWHAFLLDLSFIGWRLLSIPTLGILGLFYVNPYAYSTGAVLYETIRYGNGNVVYANSTEQ